MINIQDRQAFTDISIIIQMMSKSMKNKINPNFIKLIEENKDTEYVSNINKKIPLKEQTLNENTKIILALIYRDFLCPPNERKRLQAKDAKELQEVQEQIENEIREKYNPDDIFKNRSKNINNIPEKQIEEKNIIAFQEEKWYKKIFNLIKNLFHRN